MPSQSYNKYKVVDDVCCLSYWSNDPRTKGEVHDAVFPSSALRYIKHYGPWVYNHSNFYSRGGLNLAFCLAGFYGIGGCPIRIDNGPNYYPTNFSDRSTFYGAKLSSNGGTPFAKGIVPVTRLRHLEELKTFPPVKYKSKTEWQYLDIKIGRNRYITISINKYLVRFVPKKMKMFHESLYEWPSDISAARKLHSSKRKGKKLEYIVLAACGIMSPVSTDLHHNEKFNFVFDSVVNKFTTNTTLTSNYYDDACIEGATLLIIKSIRMPVGKPWMVGSVDKSYGYAFILIDEAKEDMVREYEWTVTSRGVVYGTDGFEDSRSVMLSRFLAEKSGLSIGEEWIAGPMTATYSRALESNNMSLRAKLDAAPLNRKRAIKYRKSSHKKYSVVRTDAVVFVPVGVGVYALDLRADSLRVGSGRSTLAGAQ